MRSDNGGGLLNLGGTLTLINCTVSGNRARDYGGGVSNTKGKYYGGRLTLSNSTISGNRAVRSGGGVDNSEYSGAKVTNSTISGNTAGDRGGGLFNG